MKRQYIIALVAAMLAIPVGAATWNSYGTYEPDTSFDVSGGFMQTDADQTADGKKLYFNVYPTAFPAGTSINNGILGSRVQQAGLQNFNAVLGPWKDCSQDGYIGLIEQALIVYPTALLLDDSICPLGSYQNDGQWVYEYRPTGRQHTEPINPDTGERPMHPMQIDDPDALVWGDIGLPGAQAAGTCPISPFPHGTTAGSGWALRYLDCFTSRRVADTVNSADPEDDLGLRFDDRDNPQQSDSLLNRHLPESLFGNPTTGETGTLQLDSDEDGGEREYAFQTWDCSGERTSVADPTGMGSEGVDVPTAVSSDGRERWADEDGNIAWISSPSPTAPTQESAADSWADGLNQTFMGVHAGSGEDDTDVLFVGGDCNFEADDANGDNSYSSAHQAVFFRFDGPFEQPTALAKKEADDYFIYFNGALVDENIAALLGPNTPGSVVSQPATQFIGTVNADPIWQSNTLWVTVPQSINRATLQASGAAYWTFYAKVGSVTLSQGFLTTGTSAKYGAEACGTFTSGVHNGWDCDATHWYTDSEYVPIVDGNEVWQARAGDVYQFRDIDCFDGTVARGSGVRASLTDLAPDPTPCRDSPI